jgi:DNA-binding response OmpR family regulator
LSVLRWMKNILVIEDENDIMAIVTLILEDEGYSVSTMSSALHYETRVRAAHADLVLLDLNIAGFNGKIICEYIKGQNDLKSIPVIIMSANLNAKQVKEECGAQGVIHKPFDLNNFIGTVRHYAA